jgi:hypothetical protein
MEQRCAEVALVATERRAFVVVGPCRVALQKAVLGFERVEKKHIRLCAHRECSERRRSLGIHDSLHSGIAPYWYMAAMAASP